MSNRDALVDIAHHSRAKTNPRLHEARDPIIIVDGEGAQVTDPTGGRYIEGMAGLSRRCSAAAPIALP